MQVQITESIEIETEFLAAAAAKGMMNKYVILEN